MSHAIIAMFDSAAAAEQARATLVTGGIAANNVSLSSAGGSTSSTSTAGATGGTAKGEPKDFWYSIKELFGKEDAYDTDANLGYYAEGSRRGAVVVRVNAQEDQVDHVVQMLHSAGAVDVDAMAQQWRGNGWTGSTSTPASATAARPLSPATKISASSGTSTSARDADLGNEDLAVGSRVISHGGVRVIRNLQY